MDVRRRQRCSVTASRSLVSLNTYALAFAVALSPALLQTSSCGSMYRLAELEILVDGQNQLEGFEPGIRNYDIAVPSGAAVVRAIPTRPTAEVWLDVDHESSEPTTTPSVIGGGDFPIALEPGHTTLTVNVKASGVTSFYTVGIDAGSVFPCTEQGILDAIAMGGGAHTFACSGPTTVVTQGEIVIDNDVILDGEGNLTVEGTAPQGVLVVLSGITSELVGLGIVPLGELPNRAIRNEGSLTLSDCVVEAEGNYAAGMIYSEGSLALRGTVVRDVGGIGHCPGINSFGSLTLMDSTVSGITAPDGHGICSSGSILLLRSAVVNNPNIGAAILSDGDATLVNSTVSGNTITVLASSVAAEGTLTLINSTLVFSGGDDQWTISAGDFGGLQADLYATNSILVGPPTSTNPPTGTCTGFVTLSGGGNIESPGNTCGFDHPTDLVNVTAAELNLGPLADNGGPTMTHALLPGSVAIDYVPAALCVDENGDPLTTDQRDVARPQDSYCDAGAFESADCSRSVCDDGNDCTADYCDPPDYSWCVNNALPDGTSCGTSGLCESGACVPQPSWGAPELIGDTGDARVPRVAFDGAGNAIVVWLDLLNDSIWSNRYTPGSGWGTPLLVSGGATIVGPRIAVDPDGNATTVWKGSDGLLWSSRYTSSSGWGTPVPISTTGNAQGYDVVVDPEGSATVVWAQADPTWHSDIWSNRYTSSSGWGTAGLIETNNAGSAILPRIAVDAGGNVTVVWSQSGGTFRDIWSNRYAPSAGWGTPVLIESNNSAPASGQTVAADTQGNALAVWSMDHGTAWFNWYTPGAGWGTEVSLGHSLGATPELIIDSSGHATIVWGQSSGEPWRLDDSRFDLWTNRYTPPSGWGTPVVVENSDATSDGAQGWAAAADSSGNITAVWTRDDGTLFSVWSNRFRPATGWGTAELISSGNAQTADVAVDQAGTAVAVWQRRGEGAGFNFSIWSNRSE